MKLFKYKPGFIIFGLGRSGSNLLRSLLNSHPKLYCDVELFNPRSHPVNNPWKIKLIYKLPLLFIMGKNLIHYNEMYGFKMFVWQHHKVEFILKTLVRKGWKILHLKRINVLKQVFSLLIAKQVQRWVNTEPDYNPNEIYEMDPEMVLKTLRNYKSNHIQSETLMKVIDHLEVIYEYDLKKEGSWQKTAIKIFDFLEIENTEVIAGTYLTDQRSDQERIANFDEIITHLIQNGFKEEVDIYYRCENQKV